MKTRVVPMGTIMPEGQGIPPEIVQITRMAPAHVKMMVFTIYRLIREREKEQDCIIPIPKQTLDDMKIEVPDWAAFWGETKDEGSLPIPPVDLAPSCASTMLNTFVEDVRPNQNSSGPSCLFNRRSANSDLRPIGISAIVFRPHREPIFPNDFPIVPVC